MNAMTQDGYVTADGRQIGGVLMEMKNITLRFGGVDGDQGHLASTSARARSARSSGRTARASRRC